MTVEAMEAAQGAAAALRVRLDIGGPLLVKLGHFLGTRPDLVDDAYIDALVALPDRAPAPLPWETVRALLADAWSAAPEEALRSITVTPHAARILDQRHAATLPDGTPVSVRIIRPDARALVAQIETQRHQMQEIVALCCAADRGAMAGVIGGFRTWLVGQMDLAAELRHRNRIAASGDEQGADVAVVSALCTPDILVTAEEPGRPFTPVGEASAGETQALVRLAFRQIFRRGTGQDAPLASNITKESGRPAEWIGRGPYRPLTSIERQDVRALWSGLHAHDEASVLRAVLRSLQTSEKPALERLELLILSAMRRDVAARPEHKATTRRDSHGVDDVLLGILRAVRQTGLTMADGPLSAHRLLVATYRIVRLASAEIDPDELGRRCLAKLDIRDALDTLDLDQMGKVAVDLLLLLRDAPERLNQIAADLAEGSLGITLALDESSSTARAWNRRVRLIATAIASLGPFFLLSEIGTAELWGIPAYVALGPLLAVLYGWMLLQWRKL
jgi:ubiquinone biosynthesis protein